jgi:serine/threonine-protein kinase HipA
MTTRRIDVRLGTNAIPVGEFLHEVNGNRESSGFTYHASWLENPRAFAIAPDIPLQQATFYFAKTGNVSALPGPIADGSPDSWGRAIIKSARGGRVSSDLDYLLDSDDMLRSGALRYFDKPGTDGTPLAAPRGTGGVSVPRLFDLEQIIAESRAFEADPAHYRESRAKTLHGGLLKDAVGSLGGARPKVNAQDDEGNLWIVKLAKMDDEYAVARAEVMALRLADRLGIKACSADIVPTSQRFPVAIVRRFDRIASSDKGKPPARVPFISAQTFMGLRGTEPGNYVDLAQQMLIHCADPDGQVRELFKRMTYSVLVHNTDDHLRNHGFLASAGKWSLSPAFDINPVPEESTLKTAISEVHGNELSVASLIDAAPYFATSEDEARQTATAMAKQISQEWRQIATRLGMSSRDMQVIAPAMENRQIDEALALGQPVTPGNRPSKKPIARQP